MRCLNCSHEGITTETQVCPGCGVYLPSLVRELLPPGTLLHGGKYRIEYALGRGGFGVTYVARHVSLEQQVAVKEFFPRDFASRDSTTGRVGVGGAHKEPFQRSLRRFVREGQTLALVNHPSVVRVRDQFEELDTAYLVMDLISPARTLREELDAQPGRRLPPARVETVAGELVEALEAVHRTGVYHLDIKPDNILLTPGGRPILVDFGASRRGLSSQSTQAFTLEYAAPEVLAGEDVGPESDLFELGMVLHEMLTGERPPTAMSRLLKSEWKPAGLEAPWAEMVASAVRMKKEERPQSVAEWWRQGLSTVKAKSPRKRKPKPAPTQSEEQKPAPHKEQQFTTAQEQKPALTQEQKAAPSRKRKSSTQTAAGTTAQTEPSSASAATDDKSRVPVAWVGGKVGQLLREGQKESAVDFYCKTMGVSPEEARKQVEEIEKNLEPVDPEWRRAVAKSFEWRGDARASGPATAHPVASSSKGGAVGLLFVIVIVAGVVIYNVYPRLTQNSAASRNISNRPASGSQIGLPVPTPEVSKPSQAANYAAVPDYAVPNSAAFATKYCERGTSPVRSTPDTGAPVIALCPCGAEVSVTDVTETLDPNTGRVLYQWAEIRYTSLVSGKSIEGWVLSSALADQNPC